MVVMIDSTALAVEDLGLTTLGQVLCHVQQQNRLVTQVLIDGLAPDLEHVPQLRGRALGGHTVFIETTEPRQITLEVIDAVEMQLTSAEEIRLEAIEDLQRNEPGAALGRLSGCFTVWQAAQQSIEKVSQLLRVDLNRVRVADQSLGDVLAEFVAELKRIRTALEHRDYVLLADTLAYEVGDTVAAWRLALVQLRAIVA